jgi:hypothetical protein
MSDATTRGEVSAGKPPSYSVMYRDADDQMQMVPGRYNFDPSVNKTADAKAKEENFANYDAERRLKGEEKNMRDWMNYYRNLYGDEKAYNLLNGKRDAHKLTGPPKE